MKIRFGEFPEEHHFLQIMRPFVEWMFKFFGWLVIISTVQFVQERTGSVVLFYVKWFSYFLILGFLGAFVDWVFSFRRYRTISGKRLAGIAMAGTNVDANETVGVRVRKFLARVSLKAQRVLVVLISLCLTVLFLGTANIVTDKIISALVEFQHQTK